MIERLEAFANGHSLLKVGGCRSDDLDYQLTRRKASRDRAPLGNVLSIPDQGIQSSLAR
ncbi:hypothetical protein QM565_15260 [Geitlerinema splendidum]|nr:hypothetical protein [Geitlerinema splendidum]